MTPSLPTLQFIVKGGGRLSYLPQSTDQYKRFRKNRTKTTQLRSSPFLWWLMADFHALPTLTLKNDFLQVDVLKIIGPLSISGLWV
jgi:hypothetical protein